MEASGKIIAALEPRSGIAKSTGNPWKVQEFVIEVDTNSQYPRRMVFEVFGEDKLNEFAIQVGEFVTVSFDIDAREYNGRWYNSVRVWRVVRGAAQTPNQPMPQAIPPTAPTADPFGASDSSADDLPF
ncbi:MAG: DUF3127 domain-containing protein [Bacteroidales bacterium]|nr:DUF3127 domain-containing protein [Bacteroidales bacterium]